MSRTHLLRENVCTYERGKFIAKNNIKLKNRRVAPMGEYVNFLSQTI